MYQMIIRPEIRFKSHKPSPQNITDSPSHLSTEALFWYIPQIMSIEPPGPSKLFIYFNLKTSFVTILCSMIRHV